jgi:hypothetical protein
MVKGRFGEFQGAFQSPKMLTEKSASTFRKGRKKSMEERKKLCAILGHQTFQIKTMSRPIHPDFQFLLDLKDQELIDLFTDLRQFILDLYPDSNELLYHTHALTAVFSISDKLSDAFCMLPIYSNHLNLGFNKGTLLKDPAKLLTGTGNLIRHVDVKKPVDYRNPQVQALVQEAIDFAIQDMDKPTKVKGGTISKIKK